MRLHPAVASTMIAVGGLLLLALPIHSFGELKTSASQEVHREMMAGILLAIEVGVKLLVGASLIYMGVSRSLSRQHPEPPI